MSPKERRREGFASRGTSVPHFGASEAHLQAFFWVKLLGSTEYFSVLGK